MHISKHSILAFGMSLPYIKYVEQFSVDVKDRRVYGLLWVTETDVRLESFSHEIKLT